MHKILKSSPFFLNQAWKRIAMKLYCDE